MLDKKYYEEKYKIDEKIKDLGVEFSKLQRRLESEKISLIIMVDGFESSGKGSLIKDIIRELDQRYCHVEIIDDPNNNDYAFNKAIWKALPKYGEIKIFDRCTYYEYFDKMGYPKEFIHEKLDQIMNSEKTIHDNGTIIFKFFIDISRETQKERIKEYLKDPYKTLYVSERDKMENLCYKSLRDNISDILKYTDKTYSPWFVISGEDVKEAGKKALKILLENTEKEISVIKEIREDNKNRKHEDFKSDNIIDSIDLNLNIDKKEYDDKIEKLQKRADELSLEMKKSRKSAVIVFEGMDAAGKGGSIKRLMKEMDPRNTFVSTTAKPDSEEYSYNYLWRFYRYFPKKGDITVFDRSWYGRVMVERIEGFANVGEWEKAYEEINNMEKELYQNGVIVIKYFLCIDKEEQLMRFKDREDNPDKRYKITDEDWRNRDKWDLYLDAINDMIKMTDKKKAPWILVEANSKRYARIKVLETFIDIVEKALKEN